MNAVTSPPNNEPPDLAAFMADEYERATRVAGRLMGGRWDLAEDVVHDAFVRAAERVASFRGEASFRTWFYRIVTTTALSRHRRHRVRERLSAWLPVGDPAETVATPMLREALIDALASLSSKQRRIFVLVALEGFTLDEAAAVVGCAPGTARSHQHRALTSLRSSLAHLRDDHGT